MFIFLLCVVIPAFLESQPNPQSPNAPEQNLQHPLVPKRIPADSLPLIYRHPDNPEIRVLPKARPKMDTIDFYNMPNIVIPEYHSNMPIMVPDTSVHYHLKIKKIEKNNPYLPMPVVPKDK
jgi:hypothetical protein